mgnify:CR=1 FL=1
MNKTQLNNAKKRWDVLKQLISNATTPVVETKQEQQKRIAMLLKPKNYTQFFDYYFGQETTIPLTDSPCATFHQKSYEELYNNPFINQFRLWFRGSAKSTHTIVGNAAHLLFNNQCKFVLIIGINQDRAEELLSELQVQLQHNRRIINDFGAQVKFGSWEKGSFETNSNCVFMALGIDQPFRGLKKFGNRVDLAIVDDCEDIKVALNQRRVRERCDKITRDLGGAFSLKIQRMVICNNYITRTGIIETLLTDLKTSPYTKVNRQNIVDKKGKPNWHQRYSMEDVERFKLKYTEADFESEFMNNPIVVGKIFKREWFKFQAVPKSKPDGILGFWDLSYKQDGDYKAFALVGLFKNQLYLLDCFCQQTSVQDAFRWYYQRMEAYEKKGWIGLQYYDATAAQEAVFSPIIQGVAQEMGSVTYPLPDRTANIDKHLRIEATLTTVFQHGKICVNKKLENNPHLDKGLTQLMNFEKGTKAHDDFPDALECAVRLIQRYFKPLLNADLMPFFNKRNYGDNKNYF